MTDMAPARTLCCFALALAFASTAVSQVITGFGSSEQNPLNINSDFVFPWAGTQTATTVSVTGVSNSAGGIFQSLASSPVFLPEPEVIALTGTTVSLPGGVTQFDIVLYDANNNTLRATFDWASFVGGATVTADLVADEGTFDGSVASWELSLFGSPNEEVSFTFDELAVVPEPAVVALVGGAGVMLLLRRRRRARI
jgi:PEP-CTERM putative exosortase interaction domain